MSLKIIAFAAMLAIPAVPALAEDMSMDMSKPMGSHDASSQAFSEANDKMHKDMMIEYSGDADADFVRGMIPHHQGAIDMSQEALGAAGHEEVRALARSIIDSQQKEIDQMVAWRKEWFGR